MMLRPDELADLADALSAALREGGDAILSLMDARGPDILAALQGRAEEQVAWPSRWNLRRPTEILGDTYSGFDLREPTGDEVLKFGVLDGVTDGAKTLELISTVSGKPLPFIKRVPGHDVLSLSAKLGRFFASALA